jgi:phosphohistidine swiveling domain-containing protein
VESDTKPLLLELASIEPGMLPLVGGKAANLGVLVRAGFPVPPGTCLTTVAYSRVVGDALDGVVRELDAAASAGGAGIAEIAARARALVRSAPVPEDVADAVRRSVPGPLAVRSSATAEDLPQASFAGQQDTYLNVVGADAVLDAVRSCWASLWTDRAVAYRAANGVDHRAVRLAVVLQEMVDAQVAGVMFTANPVTGKRRQVVLDASPGLGEAVVSGAVNPDHFVVDVDSGRIVERRLGDKLVAVRPASGGGVQHLGQPGGAAACLTDDEVRALADLGARVEDSYGSPQDIEWALAHGRFWLTQARPITTLFPVPPGRGGLRVFFSASVAQGVYRPLTPMGLAALRATFGSPARLWGIAVTDPLAGPPAASEAGGRLFMDVTAALRSSLGRWVVPRLLDVMEARSAIVLRSLFDDPRFGVVPGSPARVLATVTRIMVRHRLPVRFAGAVRDPAAAQRRAEAVGAALRTRLGTRPDATATERLDHVERILTREFASIAMGIVPLAGAGFAMLGVAVRLLRGRTRPGEVSAAVRSLPDNVTTEMDMALWRLATRMRQDPASAALLRDAPPGELVERLRAGTLPATADEGLRDFLAVYGHRAVAEIDIGLPRWSEDPSYILGVLANYLRLTDFSSAPDVQFDRGAREAEATVEELAGRLGGVRGRVVRFALGRARALMGLRETPKFYLVTMLAAARSELAAVGRELYGRGLLDAPDDVFFLDLRTVRDAVAGADLRGMVTARREDYERELRRRHVPRVLLSDGTEPEALAGAAAAAGTSRALTGTPASAGAVTAGARVVLDPLGVRLEPGEILVCPSTDPGWTPLFLTAGGLVMEMGGANSHGAVVAREYGIPAVVGVAHATERIVTGTTITVDGTSGTVSIDG